jgi:hypothetical protein
MKVFLRTFLHFGIEKGIPAKTSHLHWEFKCSSVKYAIMKAKQKLLFMVISPFSTTPASHINQSGKRTNVISTTLPSLALLYFQSHMIEKHSFVSDTDACFNCESTGKLGYYIPVPDQLVYIFCKQCQIFQDLDTYS